MPALDKWASEGAREVYFRKRRFDRGASNVDHLPRIPDDILTYARTLSRSSIITGSKDKKLVEELRHRLAHVIASQDTFNYSIDNQLEMDVDQEYESLDKGYYDLLGAIEDFEGHLGNKIR